MKKGKFIVIDGIDGSGKATQVDLLVKRLRKEGYQAKKIDFPRYGDNFFGCLIGECLAGQYGNFAAVAPKIASILYAADRWESSEQIKKWLAEGMIVIADRYVSSNQIHQGGKIKDPQARKMFLKWLDQMEYDVFKIPRPDQIIFLHLPLSLSLQLIAKRQKETHQSSRGYLGGKKDVVEKNIKYLENSRNSAIKIVKENNQWTMIECAKNGEVLPREEINDKVLAVVKKIIK